MKTYPAEKDWHIAVLWMLIPSMGGWDVSMPPGFFTTFGWWTVCLCWSAIINQYKPAWKFILVLSAGKSEKAREVSF